MDSAQCPHSEYVNVAGASHMVAGDRNDVFGTSVISSDARGARRPRSGSAGPLRRTLTTRARRGMSTTCHDRVRARAECGAEALEETAATKKPR